MGIWKEEMSRKWEGVGVKKTVVRRRAGGEQKKLDKGFFFIFIFGTFSKASHLKRDFFEFL